MTAALSMAAALPLRFEHDDDDRAAAALALAELRARARRLEHAQRQAFYGTLYAALAVYHLTSEHPRERVRACWLDAERCHRFAVAVVFGPEASE